MNIVRNLYQFSQRELDLNPENKVRRLYFMVAIAFPLGVLTVVFSKVAGDFSYHQIVLIACWTTVALYNVWKSFRPQIMHPAGDSSRWIEHWRASIWFERYRGLVKIVSFLALLASITLLFVFTVLFFIRGTPYWYILNYLWLILVNGSEFFFVRVFTDESLYY